MSITGIRNRLLVLALLPGAVIALVLFGYFTYGQLELANRSLQERGITIARQLAPASEYGFIAGNVELLDQLSAALLQQADVNGVLITDTERRVIFAAGELAAYSVLPVVGDDAAQCADYGKSLLFCAPIVKTVLPVSDFMSPENGEKRVIGAVYVGIATASLQYQRNAIVIRAVLITAALLLLTGYFAVRMGKEISRPLLNLTTAVAEVAEGNLELRTSSGAKGEIGQLESGIDAMIGSLRVARDEMQSNIDNATLQLRNALRELEVKNLDLEEQRLKAQAASEAKSRFLANMSHEIRTPLSGMVGLLFLLRHTRLTVEQQEYLDNLEGSAATLRTLIDDILDLSRIEAGRLLIHEQEFVLRTLTSSVAVMMAPAAHQKDVELIVHIGRDIPQWVMGDPLRLRQVLTNLLGNAVKFTDKGHVRLYISIVEEEKGWHDRQLRFVIEDSGIGIAQDKLDYIFESFAQADESTTRRYGGSGLGTTISRELVSLMGGTLKVESRPGQGTCFSFILPMLIGGDSDGAEHPHNEKSILLLEENQLAADAEKECIESHGYNVDLVSSEEQLLAAISERHDRYQLILLAENGRVCKWNALARRLSASTADTALGALIYYDSDCDSSEFDWILHKPLDGDSVVRRLGDRNDDAGSQRVAEEWAPSKPGSLLTVLLAEDDAINARVMSFFLRQNGHVVITATNGRAALGLLESSHFDVAFLDMRMPEMDGLMVAREWRKKESPGRHLPLIAVTANVTREDREACFAAGMDDFVSKPVDPERLAELLQRYIARRASAT